MEKPPSSDESDVEEHKIDIHAGIEVDCFVFWLAKFYAQIRIKHDADVIREPFSIVDHPHIVIETVGKIDNSKLWVSDKKIDATIYLTEKAIETRFVQQVFGWGKMSVDSLATVQKSTQRCRWFKID